MLSINTKRLKVYWYMIFSIMTNFLLSVVLLIGFITLLITRENSGSQFDWYSIGVVTATVYFSAIVFYQLKVDLEEQRLFKIFPMLDLFSGHGKVHDITDDILRADLATLRPSSNNNAIMKVQIDTERMDSAMNELRQAVGHRFVDYSWQRHPAYCDEGYKEHKTKIVGRVYINYLFDEDLVIIKLLLG